MEEQAERTVSHAVGGGAAWPLCPQACTQRTATHFLTTSHTGPPSSPPLLPHRLCPPLSGALRDSRPDSPGEGEVHEADDGEAEQGDGVRPVEEVYGDVLHLLLVDHAEMHPVVHIILAQSPAPHAGCHSSSPRPAAAPEAPAREGWDPGSDRTQKQSRLTLGPGLAPGEACKHREGPAREGGVAAPPPRPRAGGGCSLRRPALTGRHRGTLTLSTLPRSDRSEERGDQLQVPQDPGRLCPRPLAASPPAPAADGLAHRSAAHVGGGAGRAWRIAGLPGDGAPYPGVGCAATVKQQREAAARPG